MKKIFIILLIIVMFIFGVLIFRNSLSPEFNISKFNYYFDELEQNDKFMGDVSILKNGKNIYSRTIGFSDVENNIKSDTNTSHRIGSTSKTFTAVLTLKAIEENKLKLNQTLDQFFPSIQNAEKITIEYLLNHRSGIYSVTSEPNFMDWRTEEKTRNEILDIIKSGEVQFEPNSQAYYSNSNYILLSYILEDIYKKSYSDILEEKITIPLGLQNTFFVNEIDTLNNMSHSYKKVANWEKQPISDISIPMGAGGISSTSNDIGIFIQAVFNGNFLKKETLEKMKNIQNTVGLGIFEIEYDGKIAYEHPGTIDGFKANFIYIPDDEIIISYVSNGFDFDIKKIEETILKAVYNKDFEIPKFGPTYDVKSEDLDKYLGIYSTPEISWLEIDIKKDGNILTAKGTAQDEFAAVAVDKNKFKIGAINAKFEFVVEENKMIWEQNGKTHIFTRE